MDNTVSYDIPSLEQTPSPYERKSGQYFDDIAIEQYEVGQHDGLLPVYYSILSSHCPTVTTVLMRIVLLSVTVVL